MRAVLVVLLLVACGDPAAVDAGLDAGPFRDAGGSDSGETDAGDTDAGGSDAGRSDAGSDAGPPPPCTWDDLRPPPASVFWPEVLTATGPETLRGHGHDDARGPLGFCAGTRAPGQPFYRLIAVGFETDEDVNGDGDPGDPLPVDFWRDPSSATGIGESAGRVNIYIEIVDESDVVLNRFSAPGTRFVREIRDGPTEAFEITDKPPNEFQTNFAMFGGAFFGVSIEGASDRVLNMRLPVNHHVTFELVFRREDARD